MAVIAGGSAILPDQKRGSVYLPGLIVQVGTTYGTSGESDWIQGTSKFSSLILQVKIANISGGSPTLGVYLQQMAPDKVTIYDIASMTTIIANGTFIQHYTMGAVAASGAAIGAPLSLTQGTFKAFPMGDRQRVALVYGGSMTSDITVAVEYIQ